jgi:hypothetical protein
MFAPTNGTNKPPNVGPTIPEMLNCNRPTSQQKISSPSFSQSFRTVIRYIRYTPELQIVKFSVFTVHFSGSSGDTGRWSQSVTP